MTNNRPKIRSAFDLVDRINILRAEIKERETELNELASVQFQEISPEPDGFDYKEAILKLFGENPLQMFNTEAIFKHIASKYNFSPSKETISLRTTYLVDNAKKLERVEGKRGTYRLRSKTETPNSTEQGVG